MEHLLHTYTLSTSSNRYLIYFFKMHIPMFSQCILSLFLVQPVWEIQQYWNTAMFPNIDFFFNFRSRGTEF